MMPTSNYFQLDSSYDIHFNGTIYMNETSTGNKEFKRNIIKNSFSLGKCINPGPTYSQLLSKCLSALAIWEL